jgi:hypothetical protein
MPLPESHLKSLERHLKIHEEEIATLHASSEALSREIELREAGESRDPNPKAYGLPGLVSQREMIKQGIGKREMLLALGRDQRILDTLGELLDSPELAREAARDPKAFARERGIELPSNMELNLDVYEDRVNLRVTYYDELAPFMLTWTNDGFSPPLVDPRPPA